MTEASLNILNVSRLIELLEALPEGKFNMSNVFTNADGIDDDRSSFNECGTAACIAGWCLTLISKNAAGSRAAQRWLGIDNDAYRALFMPAGFADAPEQYPLSRAIHTLKHMRSEFLRTGQVVVDWDAPEPESLSEWTAPRAIEQKLPAEITRFLGSPSHVEAL